MPALSKKSAAISRIPRPAVPLRDGGNKVRLRLRRMAFQEELDELPSDMKDLIELLIQSRARVNGGIYETVVIWNKLRTHEAYWVNFRFGSEAQFLAHYCLPDGATLAQWTVMIHLFDRATFILLGEEVLLFMMRWVAQYQPNLDERKSDYRAIFARYCRNHEAFDRADFYAVVRQHVVETYEKPLAREAGLNHELWLRSRGKHGSGKGRDLLPQHGDPVSSLELVVSTDADSVDATPAASEEGIVEDLVSYARLLEGIIREKLGESALPDKPEKIRSLGIF